MPHQAAPCLSPSSSDHVGRGFLGLGTEACFLLAKSHNADTALIFNGLILNDSVP